MPPGSIQQPTEDTNTCQTEPSVTQTYRGKGCMSLILLLGTALASPRHFQNMAHVCQYMVNSPSDHHMALQQVCAAMPGRCPTFQGCAASQVDLSLCEIDSLAPRHSSAFIQSLRTDTSLFLCLPGCCIPPHLVSTCLISSAMGPFAFNPISNSRSFIFAFPATFVPQGFILWTLFLFSTTYRPQFLRLPLGSSPPTPAPKHGSGTSHRQGASNAPFPATFAGPWLNLWK